MDFKKAVPSETNENVDDSWDLSDDQMFFIMQRHNAIFAAYDDDNMEYLQGIENLRTIFLYLVI